MFRSAAYRVTPRVWRALEGCRWVQLLGPSRSDGKIIENSALGGGVSSRRYSDVAVIAHLRSRFPCSRGSAGRGCRGRRPDHRWCSYQIIAGASSSQAAIIAARSDIARTPTSVHSSIYIPISSTNPPLSGDPQPSSAIPLRSLSFAPRPPIESCWFEARDSSSPALHCW